MKITATFDSLEEFQKYMGALPPAANASGGDQRPQKDAEPEKTPKEARETIQEAPREDAPAPEVTEGFRVEVRKTLAQLNKKVGKNLAAELIRGFGVDKLTEVALADLPALMDKAKEALDAR